MAGLYPNEVIEEVLGRTDIVDLVGGYVRLKRAGRGYMGLCPFHKEKSPSFHVSDDKQLYHCFGCGVGGNAIHFVMAAENLDFVDALKYLADRAGVILPEPDTARQDGARYEFKKKMYEANVFAAKFFRDALNSDIGEGARQYVEKRKLLPATVRRFGIGYAPGDGSLIASARESKIGEDVLLALGLIMRTERGKLIERFRNRLIVPIIDVRKNVIGFGGRALSPDEKAKYLNSPESAVFKKGYELFALNYAKEAKEPGMILCEGYMDVISLHQAGFTKTVASMGTALTGDQARTVKKYASEVYLCYDSDGPGQKATEAAAEIFRPLDVKVKVITLPDCKDPDEYIKKYGAQSFGEVVRKSEGITDYKITALKKTFDLSNVEQKVDFTKAASEVLLKIKNPIEQEAYIKKVSDESGISEDSIKAEIMKRDSGMRRREEKKIFSRPAQNKIEGVKLDISAKAYEAEKMLLALIARDKRVYDKYSTIVKAEDFSTEALRALAKELYNQLAAGKVPEPAAILSALPGEMSGQLASVFSDDDYGDNMRAADDAYATIEDERFDALSKQYIKENNIEKLNELIRKKAEKKRKEGQ